MIAASDLTNGPVRSQRIQEIVEAAPPISISWAKVQPKVEFELLWTALDVIQELLGVHCSLLIQIYKGKRTGKLLASTAPATKHQALAIVS
jgi:hypothetical protein